MTLSKMTLGITVTESDTQHCDIQNNNIQHMYIHHYDIQKNSKKMRHSALMQLA
jgi:hypothetical protein